MKWIVLCVTTESSRQSRYYSINTFYLESFKILCYKSMINTVTSLHSQSEKINIQQKFLHIGQKYFCSVTKNSSVTSFLLIFQTFYAGQ